MVQCFLPQRPVVMKTYITNHGRASLHIEASGLTDPNDPGVWIECEVPSGPKPRPILPYIVGEAVRTANPEIDLGRSLRVFMEKLGIPIAGTNGKALTAQIQNTAAATIVLGEWTKDRAQTRAGRLAKAFSFWLERHPDHPWVLVDALDEGAKDAVAEHHPPAAFLETSPDTWQGWIRLDQAVDTDARADIGRRLAETHGAAPDRAGDSQLGRCPGFTNQDPDHRQEGEQPPFTRLVDVHPEQVVRMRTLPSDIKPGITAPVREGELRPEEVRGRTIRENTWNTTPDALPSVTVARNDARESRVLRDLDPTR